MDYVIRQHDATADKWLRSDASVTTMAVERMLPPDPAHAEFYENMTPNIAKWLLPDGSIVNELPVSGGGTVEIEKRPTLYITTCNTANTATRKILSGLPEDYEQLNGDFIIVRFSQHNSAPNCSFVFSSGSTAPAWDRFNRDDSGQKPHQGLQNWGEL